MTREMKTMMMAKVAGAEKFKVCVPFIPCNFNIFEQYFLVLVL